jgi:uncharacterized protein
MSHFHPHGQRPHAAHNHPRRQFLKKSAALFSGALAATAGSPQTFQGKGAGAPGSPDEATRAASKPANPERYFVFDAHLHCPAESGELWQWHTVTRNFKEFVDYLDRTGVQRGIINSQRSQLKGTPAEFIAGNREVARYVEKYKGRFLGACVVNPLYIDEALREIEECRKQFGFIWVGELCNYTVPYQYTIKEFDLLVRQVVKQGMVLDVHTELEEMEYIIQKFPQATLVFPHFGDDQEYDHIFKRIDLVAKNKNCYLDTSGYGHDRVGMLEYAIQSIGPDRVLFGSDFSINDPSTVIARVKHSFLTEDQKKRVLSENLQELLRKVRKTA